MFCASPKEGVRSLIEAESGGRILFAVDNQVQAPPIGSQPGWLLILLAESSLQVETISD
ncbi:hypothetical protein Poly21_05450 [Allorhodopirellula heiligendammensis]|uniref:Uncharacterized protein n=1 Tax=Allorhodopirellula heiligendammensis TaxID=2714739 RepID=A0A5C6C1D7_9BACT|nr:hypothetical protein Poly21_05450 [Allorhodopirellula heiligendammensis]